MEPIVVVSIIIAAILLLLFLGASIKPFRLFGTIFVKLVIGAMLLFFLNAFGSSIGLHVPINFVTTGVVGLLGIPGLLSLAAIQYWII
ncbi:MULTISPECIES: pro-sigmaK processing inhibitor BofA family protein [Bacillus]|uniref:pro-sigmaK processing inhibitor BofA family protein n=1 Tax=Bacillus TaxID=1386 RepID=UPI0002D2DBC0|nr:MULTISPECIES: pro-sigmaK processing inhibitor BofA family protein [Bacillus]